ncbi:Crp/Fnr family transcriptional regulator [Ruminococcus sp. 5_1_39BFAA]|uniref:Crp/Fnr family transcriptional regulator n=1 Tax=Ruminococcus sp. 5_1_39BFAA TaxID=457412 RepID=UPI003567AF33
MQGKNELYRLSFFLNVTPKTLEKLWSAGSIKQFPRGHILMRARDKVDQVYIQLSGKSMVYNLTHTGRRKIIFIYGEGALLNEHMLYEHAASLFCETLEKSSIFAVSKKLFQKCMEEDFTLTSAVLKQQEWRLWRMGHQLKNTLGSVGMKQKLAAKLWKLSRDFGIQRPDGVEIDLNLSVTMLADMLGASRENTSRLCSELVDLGLLKIQKRRITITDQEKIADFYKTGKME